MYFWPARELNDACILRSNPNRMLDPFLPEKKEDVARLRTILEQMHEGFVDYVLSRRGDKLTDRKDIFTGEFWLGRRAIELGLVDGEAHMMPKLQELYGQKVRIRKYGRRRGMFSRLGATLANDAVSAIEERADYARYGL